jgi:hypothetical protein
MQAEELMLRERMDDIRQELLVLSGKGGVGKSTVAANLAAALCRAGKRVGLPGRSDNRFSWITEGPRYLAVPYASVAECS